MKTSLDHLPQRKQNELKRVLEVLHEEFEQAHVLATSSLRKNGRILKIVLFGSYARGDWVDKPDTATGHRSDYDLLIIVSHRLLTDIAKYWHVAEDRLIRDPAIKTVVNFIVHSLDEVNQWLGEGQYFFSDIKDEGIALYELPGHRLAEFKPLNPADAHRIAEKQFEHWFKSAQEFYEGFEFYLGKENLNKAAFMLHQATENFYTTLLLVLTNYNPHSHNLKFMRSLGEDLDRRLIAAWPRDKQRYRTAFELLKRAYIDARYSEHYEIMKEQLEWLGGRVKHLRSLTDQICQDRLAHLAAAAGAK